MLVPSLFLLAWILHVVAAATLGESLDSEFVQRAIALDPENAQLHFNLGTLYLWEAHSDPALAVQQLRIATELNGNVAAYWSALGKACYARGDQFCADRAFRRATDLAPAKSRYAWEAGLNYVVTNRPIESVTYLRRCVLLQPKRAQDTFELLMRAFGSSELAWNDVAKKSGNVEVEVAFLEILSRKGDFDSAARYWAEIASAKPKITLLLAGPYLESLIAASRYEDAQAIWRYLQHTGTLSPNTLDSSEFVFNPSFERDPTSIGFDWRILPHRFVAIDYRDTSSHSGIRALRIDFTVPENDAYEPVSQIVPVSANHSYVLTAYARSSNITSDSGPRLRVIDPGCPSCPGAATVGVTGTTDWHQLSATFNTSPTTKAVRVSVWRPRSRTFPMEISGQFWLDDVSVRLAPAMSGVAN